MAFARRKSPKSRLFESETHDLTISKLQSIYASARVSSFMCEFSVTVFSFLNLSAASEVFIYSVTIFRLSWIHSSLWSENCKRVPMSLP